MNFGNMLLNFDISQTWVYIVVACASLLLTGVVLFFPGKIKLPKRLWTAALGLFAGALVGGVLTWYVTIVNNTFGQPLEGNALAWILICFAGIGLVLSQILIQGFSRAGIGAGAVVALAVMGTVGVNGSYGLTPTVGELLHIVSGNVVNLPPVTANSASTPDLSSWQPPANMPKVGRQGLIPNGIPNTNSQFPARPASVYFPPAALTEHPPKLPFMVFMMGQPGDPDPREITAALNKAQAGNHGLAPITVIVDQLGDPMQDPLCIDSSMGNVETYIMKDVVSWALSHLNIEADPAHWTVGGFSNGATCAMSLATKYPERWANVLSMIGTEYAGFSNETNVIQSIFGGSAAAFDAIKPETIMTTRHYPDSNAYLSSAGKDGTYGPGQLALAEHAKDAGIHVDYIDFPNLGHTDAALESSLSWALPLLYERLGISRAPLR